ncbi:uncharacterized protein MONBRDRAFT_29409 [Monosiga brevicollis MX1]|uniref:ArnT-like N-terminal domain-containing protein n=1 Tax=Monosiga brevicollis TaxID=81824 RepID=A9VB02_MONBE|nr:uncharacterized protein MONBRDRAFT_29409 [Monosiga brevicollis MX1]EDQ85306.1 predicted protein [Monosiga brevicollis MX1]|eukprot:XP_001749927.1 hypothetical protein [Monosiga brevicollis MX1]
MAVVEGDRAWLWPDNVDDGAKQEDVPQKVKADLILDLVLISLLSLVAWMTRIYHLSIPASVAWDETHFGKFANHYIKNEFYFDVHPPLAKMLIAGAGYLTNYRGDFAFKQPGDAYEQTPYYGMRLLCATMGSAVVPMGYVAVRVASSARTPALLAAMLLLAETSLLTASRFILLDPIMLFFIQAALTATFLFRACRTRPFGVWWWTSLATTGVMLGCAISCKFVGLFIVLFVGLYTANDLWELWGDLRVSIRTWTAHFAARVGTLILLPIIVYLACFWLHFAVCYRSGPGDAFMSSGFQTTLQGSEIYNRSMPQYIALGSVVTIKQFSHADSMIQQQQVTAYRYRDENNRWLIKTTNPLNETHDNYEDMHTQYLIRSGDRIRYAWFIPPPALPVDHQIHKVVTCYGDQGIGDVNDEWIIWKEDGQHGDHIQPVVDRIRLIHGWENVTRLCALASTGKKLPKWGFEQEAAKAPLTCVIASDSRPACLYGTLSFTITGGLRKTFPSLKCKVSGPA